MTFCYDKLNTAGLPNALFLLFSNSIWIAFLFLGSQLHEAEKESSHRVTWDFLGKSFHHWHNFLKYLILSTWNTLQRCSGRLKKSGKTQEKEGKKKEMNSFYLVYCKINCSKTLVKLIHFLINLLWEKSSWFTSEAQKTNHCLKHRNRYNSLAQRATQTIWFTEPS